MTAGRKRRTSGWLTAAAFVLVLLGAYVGGYFVLSEYQPSINLVGDDLTVVPSHGRGFDFFALETAYYPMGWIECRVRGEEVFFMVGRNGVSYGNTVTFHPNGPLERTQSSGDSGDGF